MRLALKVDCDTYEGSKTGIPNLLRAFDKARIRVTFLFTLGPDNSGRAILRIFTRKGFLKKMLRSNAASLYSPKTMLYGTLLAAPDMAKNLAADIRSVAAAGHEVGVHGWDHVRWHDRLDKMSSEEIARDYGRAHAAFETIFGFKARTSGAPGWHATEHSLAVQEAYGLLYASDTRGGAPCFLESNGRRFNTLEIPSTIPTWDETLGAPELAMEADFINYYRRLIVGAEVHSIHTEVEGTARLELFERQLAAWTSDGVSFLPLEEIAKEQLANRAAVPVRQLFRTTIPNRGGDVSSSR